MPDLIRPDVAVAADMCVDLVLSGNVRPHFHQVEQLIDDYCLEAGGSANIFAAQIAKLGARARVIGRIGDDALGAFAIQRLQACGIDTSLVQRDPELRTGLGVALAEANDRAILTYSGSIDAVTAEDLPSAPERLCRHWHVASYFLLTKLRAFWPEFLARCRAAGLSTSLDTNWDPNDKWDGVAELLPIVDVFLPNRQEVMAIARSDDPVRAARKLSSAGPLVVVKLGKEGAVAVRGDEEWVLRATQPGCAAPCVVDSVGAGDNFDAGFLFGWLACRPVEECLALAHRCAVSSLGAAGGLAGQLTEAGAFAAKGTK